MGLERRMYQRVNYSEDVLLNRAIRAKARTISEGGLYVQTGQYFIPHSFIELSFPLGKRSYSLRAQVKHAEAGIGVGLVFLNLTPDQRISLKQYISAHPREEAGEKRNHVLLIDDQEGNRNSYRSKLALDGFTVFEAAGAREAYAILQREKINLVIINPYLSRENGFELLSTIHYNPPWKDLRILILAPSSTPMDILKAHEAGVSEFLLKMATSPVRLSERVKVHLSNA